MISLNIHKLKGALLTIAAIVSVSTANADGGSASPPLIETITISNQSLVNINNLDVLVNGTYDKKIRIKLIPSSEGAALVAFTSNDGSNFNTVGPYSYSSVVFDNDNTSGNTIETTGPKVYGSNGDNRAHLTPNYTSNLVGDNGLEADIIIRDPQNGGLITRVRGNGSFSEKDEDTDYFVFALARENAEVLKSLQLRFRNKTGGAFINFSGEIKIYSD